MYYAGNPITTIAITNSVTQISIGETDQTFDFNRLGVNLNFVHNNDLLVFMFEKPLDNRMIVKIHIENSNFDNLIAMNVWLEDIQKVQIVEPNLRLVYP